MARPIINHYENDPFWIWMGEQHMAYTDKQLFIKQIKEYQVDLSNYSLMNLPVDRIIESKHAVKQTSIRRYRYAIYKYRDYMLKTGRVILIPGMINKDTYESVFVIEGIEGAET